MTAVLTKQVRRLQNDLSPKSGVRPGEACARLRRKGLVPGGRRHPRPFSPRRPPPLAGGEVPLKVVECLANLGPVRCLDDLFRLNDDPTESDLYAFRVPEGVAISVASDGVWALYAP
jgi:hypothetical protein